MKIAGHLYELIGNTPLLELQGYSTLHGLKTPLLAKLESFNPLSSVKDRVGYAMIRDAEEQGILRPGSTIIEPTSGNTGIGLAFVAASKGYRTIIVMPDTMSAERHNLLTALGAELVLTDGAQGMSGAIAKAEELARSIPESFLAGQFENPSNPRIHRETTAQEIWRDTDGQVDVFIAGVGTGGTITGVGQGLKAHRSSVQIVAVEPEGSAVLSGGKPGAHPLQGIGAGFVPSILDRSVIDQVITVTGPDAIATARELARTEGLLAGISAGAAVYAARTLAQQPDYQHKRMVVLLPDTGERYLSTGLFQP